MIDVSCVVTCVICGDMMEVRLSRGIREGEKEIDLFLLADMEVRCYASAVLMNHFKRDHRVET